MSFLSTDTNGDVMRNYGNIAKDYGYKVSVIELRNPTRSNGNNNKDIFISTVLIVEVSRFFLSAVRTFYDIILKFDFYFFKL